MNLRSEPLAWAAGLAWLWTVGRACRQSVTLDEADSYLTFAFPDAPVHWTPSSGNHVLNSILERIATALFGLSHLSLRAPALLGGAIYIAACYALCRRISGERWIQWPLFVCLVYNPFVMDYLVAARGYGLALGLLMAALWAIAAGRPAAGSLCAGLSLCANFSFAYMDAAVIALAAVDTARARGWRAAAGVASAGAAAVFLLCGWTIWTWPKRELFYGAAHLWEMWSSMAAATFDELNPFLVHPMLAAVLEAAGRVLPAALVCVVSWQTLRIVWAGDPLGRLLARAMALALLCHWLAFRLLRIPLPMARTALFFVSGAMLLVGIGAALKARSRWGRAARLASIAVMSACAIYFVGCLRLGYFREWKFDAETRDAFQAVEELRHSTGISAVGTNWRYTAAMKFYRQAFHDTGLEVGEDPPAPGLPAYVLYGPDAEPFLREQKLRVIYRGKIGGVMVAAR